MGPSTSPAAEQAAHPNSGPRRRPRELPGSLVTHEDVERPTHTNCSPIFPARFKGRVVVTFDKDFGELAFRRGLAASVGVVLFRITLTSPEHAVRAAVAAFASRADWTGQFAVVEDDRIRLRALPS
jgi:hypothetical protein